MECFDGQDDSRRWDGAFAIFGLQEDAKLDRLDLGHMATSPRQYHTPPFPVPTSLLSTSAPLSSQQRSSSAPMPTSPRPRTSSFQEGDSTCLTVGRLGGVSMSEASMRKVDRCMESRGVNGQSSSSVRAERV